MDPSNYAQYLLRTRYCSGHLEAQRLEKYIQSREASNCVYPMACQLGGDLAGWQCLEGERCPDKGCPSSVSAWTQDPTLVFAELPVGTNMWPAVDGWYLGSSPPVSSHMPSCLCVF